MFYSSQFESKIIRQLGVVLSAPKDLLLITFGEKETQNISETFVRNTDVFVVCGKYFNTQTTYYNCRVKNTLHLVYKHWYWYTHDKYLECQKMENSLNTDRALLILASRSTLVLVTRNRSTEDNRCLSYMVCPSVKIAFHYTLKIHIYVFIKSNIFRYKSSII